jgi:hypothetical protein
MIKLFKHLKNLFPKPPKENINKYYLRKYLTEKEIQKQKEEIILYRF